MSSHAGGAVAIGGMSLTSHTGTNILPNWLALIWTFAFLVIIVVHARHVLETRGERQAWHSGHVLMATGMFFMFAPGSVDHFDIPDAFWQILFANAAGLAMAWILVQVLNGRAVNSLWILMAIDLAAMVYMFAAGGFVSGVTWCLVAYFGTQAAVWLLDGYRRLDGHAIVLPAMAANADGTLAAAAVAPLVCDRDLRASMSAMTLGMVYMLIAMQLIL